MQAEKSSTAAMLNAMSEPIRLDGPMNKLFSVCGKAVLFDDNAIEVLVKVKLQLKALLDKYPAEQLTSEEMKKTRNSLEKLVKLLDGLLVIEAVKNKNNNLNYFIGPVANDFYKSLDDKPSVNNDLAEAAVDILCAALDENKFSKMIFPGWGLLVKGAYAAYTAVKGDQIQVATLYLKAKRDFYRGHKDYPENAALLADVRKINENASFACQYVSEENGQRATVAANQIVALLNKVKFKNLIEMQQGLPLVAVGSVLLNLSRCQIALTSGQINGAPNIACWGINMPLDADEKKYQLFIADIKNFDAMLLKECDRICSKPPSPEEDRLFQENQRKIMELQPKTKVHNVCMELLTRFMLIVKAVDEHMVWDANPQARAVLLKYEADINGLIQRYTPDLTARELSVEQKQVLSQPEPVPQEEPKVNLSSSQTL